MTFAISLDCWCIQIDANLQQYLLDYPFSLSDVSPVSLKIQISIV